MVFDYHIHLAEIVGAINYFNVCSQHWKVYTSFKRHLLCTKVTLAFIQQAFPFRVQYRHAAPRVLRGNGFSLHL